jgi:hypothetical protein
LDWYEAAPGTPAPAAREEFQSPDGDSLDWYKFDAVGEIERHNHDSEFQSPDGDSLDWYGLRRINSRLQRKQHGVSVP